MSSPPIPHSANPSASGAPPLARVELVWAALAFLLLAIAVLWRPVARVSTHTLGHWDMLTSMSSLTSEGAAIEPLNRWTSDPVRQMLPWSVFAANELDAGRAPLWNPYNGTGTPLVANYQSAVFSPFQIPFYVLPLKLAVLTASLAKLWLAGFAMYAFLRYVGLARAAAAFGGLVFLASGSNLTILLFPHPAVSAWLPVALLVTEWLVRCARNATSWRAVTRASVVLGLVMALAALSGHPETLAANALGVGAWAVARWIGTARAGWRLGALGVFAAAVLAALLAAPQIAPFLEYYVVSRAREGGPRSASVLGWSQWPMLVFPDLAGSPVRGGTLAGLPFPNHQEVMSFYLGAPALLFACVAPWFLRRASFAWVFVGLAAALFVLVYDVAGAGSALHAVFSGHTLPLIRLNPLWTVSVAALGAWTIDRWLARGSMRITLVWCAAAAVFAAVFHFGATRYISAQAFELDLDAQTWIANASAHRTAMLSWLAFAVCAGAALSFVRASFARWAVVIALGVAQFASTAGVLAEYTPTVADELVLPRTRSLDALREQIGDHRVVFLGADELTADSNCALGVRTVTSFDALEIARYQRLMAHFFGEQRYDARTLRASVAALRLFGVRFVAAPLDWLGVDTQLGAGIQNVSGATPYLALARRAEPPTARTSLESNGQLLRQLFRPEFDGCSGLVVHFVAPVARGEGAVELEVRDVERDALVARRSVLLAQLRRVSATRSECVVTFEPIAGSSGRTFELSVRANDASTRFALWRANGAKIGAAGDERDGDDRATEDARGGWRLLRGDTNERGRIVLDLAYGNELRRVGDAGRHALFEVAESAGRAWFAERVILARDSEHAWELVTARDFDPRSTAVVEGSVAANSDARARIESLTETPTRSLWRVDVPAAAQLIVAQAYYPGWRARIDGVESEVQRANYAFCALHVPAGAREIELVYEPTSLRVGFACAALGALAVIGLLAAARRTESSSSANAGSVAP